MGEVGLVSSSPKWVCISHELGMCERWGLTSSSPKWVYAMSFVKSKVSGFSLVFYCSSSLGERGVGKDLVVVVVVLDKVVVVVVRERLGK
jgi:hypothetical protein